MQMLAALREKRDSQCRDDNSDANADGDDNRGDDVDGDYGDDADNVLAG